jgi:hypothetical protein
VERRRNRKETKRLGRKGKEREKRAVRSRKIRGECVGGGVEGIKGVPITEIP